MSHSAPNRSLTPGFTILLAINLVLCLIAAEILDYVTTTGDTTLILLSVALLLVLLALLAWSLWRMRKSRLVFPSVGLSVPVPQYIVWPSLLIFILLATGLRFYQLGTESFWYDEVWTANWADQALGAVVKIANPLAYILAHVSLQMSRSEFILRFAPALAGVLTVPVIYHLGRTIYSPREGLVAAFLFSVSVYAIYHSQELRFYAWHMLFSTLTLYFLLRGLERNRVQDWLGFALSTALNLYNHPLALLVLASEGLYVAFALSWDVAVSPELRIASWSTKLQTWLRRAIWPGVAAVAALVIYLPQLPALLRFYNPNWVVSMEPNPTQPLSIIEMTWQFDPIVYGIHGLFGSFIGSKSYPILLFLLLTVFVLGLLCSQKRTVVLVLIWMLFPLPIILLAQVRIHGRYFSYFLPLIWVVIAHSLNYLARAFGRQRKSQEALLFVLTLLVAVPNLIRLPGYYALPQKTQWRELAAFVDARRQPGDLLLTNCFFPLIILPFDWYTTTPEDALPRSLFPKSGALTDLAQLDDLPDSTQGHRRVWFVIATKPPEAREVLAEAMQTNYRQVGEWSFVGLHLLLFEANPPGGK